jgi:hypothetical protein
MPIDLAFVAADDVFPSCWSVVINNKHFIVDDLSYPVLLSELERAVGRRLDPERHQLLLWRASLVRARRPVYALDADDKRGAA